MTPVTLQSKQIKVQAVKWDGSAKSLAEIQKFVPENMLGIEHIENEGTNLVVYNSLEFQWISIPLGHWIIRGIKDEYYPGEEDMLFKKYIIVDENLTPVPLTDLLDTLRNLSLVLRTDEYVKASELEELGWSLNGIVNRIVVNGIQI